MKLDTDSPEGMIQRMKTTSRLGRSSAGTALALLTLLAGGLVAAPAQAQETGRIVGRLVSQADGSPVDQAQLVVEGTGVGTMSDLNGRYVIRNVPAGTHAVRVEMLGYQTKTVTGIEVRAGQVTPLEITLSEQAIAIDGLTVTATQERGSTASVLREQRTPSALTEGIGSAQIARSPDSHAAESVRRLTGVTVSENKYVYVRGLGERYSQTSLNGSPLPSPEPEKGVVPLDLFPSGFLENLTVQKTYTPDRPADFSGGSVEIETKDYPDRFTAKVSLGSSYNTESTLADGFLSYSGGRLDFLGMDDGSRDIPGAIRSELGGLGGARLPKDDPAAVERLGESFLGTDLARFAPTSGTGPANGTWGFSLGDRTELLGREFGYLVSGTYSNSYELIDDEIERKWRTSAFDPDLIDSGREEAPNVDYTFVRGTQDVSLGGLGNFTYLLSPTHQIGLKTLFKRSAEDEARRFQGANREDLGGILIDERLRFIARTLTWGQLSGQHKLGDTRFEWRATLARATRDEPGLREVIFRKGFSAPEDAPFYVDNEGPAPRYLFNELHDDDLNGKVDYTIPFSVAGVDGAELKVGGMARVRDRDFEARRFRWEFRGQFTSLDSALTADRVVGHLDGRDQFVLDEVVEPGDNYITDDQTYGGYTMLTLPLGPVEVVGGVRIEDYRMELDAEGGDQDADLESFDVLPALNATYRISDRMNVRAGFSRTLDRPEFRELAPFQFTEAISLRQVFGNPDLKIAEIRNFDLRWEFYPSPDEVVTVGVFYKQLERPIEQVWITTSGTAYSYQNSDEGELRGIEAGVQKNLGFLAGFLDPFSFGGNVALIDSEVTVSPEGIFDPTNLKRPLEGQSPWTANASLAFRTPGGGTEVAVFYNVFGERITAAGGAGLPNIVEQPRPQLDLTVKQSLTRGLELTAKARNLLDSEHLWEQSANGVTRVQRSFSEGRTFSVSVSFTKN